MDIEVIVQKEIPVKDIQKFEQKTIYNTAVYTREYTKSSSAYPYLSGRLQSTEVSLPVLGSGMEYSLGAGVSYAMSVWNKTNANWTNPSTQPQWYYSIFKKQGATIVSQAVNTALKEI